MIAPRRFRATVEYDGTDFFGFQRQKEQRSVQGELEQALSTIAKTPVTIVAAGRTDSGVHARGQVIAFDLSWNHPIDNLQRALNANLAKDVAVRSLTEAAADFHPRYNAWRRAYRYYIYNTTIRSPLNRRQSWHLWNPLDIEAMNQAALCLLGQHDFATFGQPIQSESTVRDLYVAQWRRVDEFLLFDIEANAFLYRMVRSLVGSLVEVGHGRWSPADFQTAFLAADRAQAGQTAPAQGLFLMSVFYDDTIKK